MLRRASLIGFLLCLSACDDGGSPANTGFDLPTALSLGGPVLGSPRLQPIYFDGFPYANDIDLFLSRLQTSAYWPAVGSEYGVGAPTALPGYTTAVTVPTTVADDAVAALLSRVFDEAAASATSTLGLPRTDTIYVLFFAPSTTVTVSGQAACGESGISGFHSELTVGAIGIPVAVIPACSSIASDSTLTGVSVLTPAASHEMIEAATDPFVMSNPAFGAIDGAHALWGEAIGGSELADLCEDEQPSVILPDDIGYPVQRVWSNASAQAGRGPCVPVPAGEVYFNCVAALPDRAPFTNQAGAMFTLPALSASIGQSLTAEVTYHGGRGAPATWDAVAFELDATDPTPSSHFPAVTGAPGQTQFVRVAPSVAGATGLFPLPVAAGSASAVHFWIGAVNRH